MEGDGLFSDAQASKCPPGCASDLKPNDNQMYIKIMNEGSPQLSAAAKVYTLDIGGECYASLYPDNEIIVTIDDNQNFDYFGLNANKYKAECRNGKFDITIHVGGLPVPRNFTVRAKLVAIDSEGVEHINASNGSSSMDFIRTN
jgi:hypothetical protein